MKSLEKFVELFAEQFDNTDALDINADTVFHEMDEYSSLIALSIISMIDDEFDVAIKGDEMRSAITVGDLYNIIMNKI